MAVISLCGNLSTNTGFIDCDPSKGTPVMIIFGSGEFSTADQASSDTFETALIALTKLPRNSTQKLYPLPLIQGVNDTTEAATFGTLGYGLRKKLRRSKPGFEFDILAGSTLEKYLMAFDGKIVPALVYDDQNIIWGVEDKAGNFKGAKYLVNIEPQGYGDSSNIKTTKVGISIVDSRDFVENAAGFEIDLPTDDIKGLSDVTLKAISHVDNVWKVSAKINTAVKTKAVNIAKEYSTELADVDLFTAKTGAAFDTALTITSVTYDAVTESLVFTFDSTAYTALSSGAQIKLDGAIPTVLDAADVTNIEFVSVILTK